jgi:hypothetical protein
MRQLKYGLRSVHQPDCCHATNRQDYHLGVPTLTGSEEGGVSLTVCCVHHCPMLHQQLAWPARAAACRAGKEADNDQRELTVA